MNKIWGNGIAIILVGWFFFIFNKFYSEVEPKWIYYLLIFLLIGIYPIFSNGGGQILLKKVAVRTWISLVVFLVFFIFGLHPKECVLFLISSLAWFSIGRYVLNKITHMALPKLDEAVFSLSIGMVLFSFIVLGLGVIGKLSAGYLLFIIGVIDFAGIAVFIRTHAVSTIRKSFEGFIYKSESALLSQNSLVLIILIILSAHFFLFIVGNLAPPTLSDDIAYHLSAGKMYARNHSISFIPYFNLPFSQEMLCALGVVLGSEYIFSGLVNIVYDLLLLGAFYIFGKKYFHPLSGLLGFLFLFTILYYNIHAFSFAVDLKYLTCCILAFYSFLAFIKTEEKAWLWLTATIIGLSLNYRYQGFLILAFFLISLIIVQVRRESRIRMKLVPSLFIFLFFAGIFGFPWYLKNFFETGNPIFPAVSIFFNGFFGDPEMNELYRRYASPNFPFIYGRYGFGVNLESFIKLPWRVTFLGGGFEGYLFTPIYLGFFPLALFYIRRQMHFIIFSFFFFYSIVWFFQMQQLKFLIPSFALLGILIAHGLLGSLKKVPEYFRFIVICLIFVSSIISLKILFFERVHFLDKLPAVLKIEDKEDYLLRKLSTQRIVSFMNRNIPNESYVFSSWELSLFYLDRKYFRGSPGIQLFLDYKNIENLSEFLSKLKKMGATHILTNKNREEIMKNPFLNSNYAALYLIESRYDYRYLKKIFETDEHVIYKIDYPEKSKSPGEETKITPVMIGDVLYKFGRLDLAQNQYERASTQGISEGEERLKKIIAMRNIEKGDYYLNKAKEMKLDTFLKIALDEYSAELKKSGRDSAKKRVLEKKIDEVYEVAMNIIPHIWGHISRMKVEI